MKTKIALIAIFAGVAMMSCQKEAEIGTSYQPESVRQSREAGIRNPQTVTTNRVDQKFGYDAKGRLELIINAGRQQKRFEYDSEDRVTVLALPESGEEIWFRYEIGAQPVDAIRIKTLAGGATGEFSDIVFTYDEFGRKIAEVETERESGSIISYSYEYDEFNRLLSTMKSIDDRMVSLVRPDVFIDGSSHVAGLDVLSLEPGVSLQKGLPTQLLIDDESGHNEVAYTYALNALGQPDLFTSSTNGRRAIKSKVAY
jgi:YD repeat-containing protein